MRLRRRSDKELAATKYAGRESASQRAARVEDDDSASRRRGHRRSLLGAARQGQAWEDRDRSRFGS